MFPVGLLEAVLSSADNYQIFGRPEFGKTTLLRSISLQILRSRVTLINQTVPCLIHFADIKAPLDRLIRHLRAQLPECPTAEFSFDDLLSRGSVLILVDDLDFEDHKRVDLLLRLIKKFPKNRYIFSTNTPYLETLAALPSLEAAVPFQNLFLKPFSRREMRSLVEKWDRDNRLDREVVLDRLVNDIVQINIPLTAVNGTILLSIFETQGDFIAVNRAVLIERFIELLLRKYETSEIQSKNFDFRNKTHYLAHIAGVMCKKEHYLIEYADLISETEAYCRAFGLTIDTRKLIDSFIHARILTTRQLGRISFRYRAFLEYFVACQMRESKEFRDFVLSEGEYLRYINEIEFYSGISRNDSELLEIVLQRFADLTKTLLAQIGWDPDITKLSAVKIPSDEGRDDMFDEIERQIDAPKTSETERDEVLEAEMPKDVGKRQEVFRPLYADDGQRWTMCLLLYSGIAKNSELIPDSIKRRHLTEILHAWGAFTLHSLLVIPSLVKNRKVIVNGVTYTVDMPADMTDNEVAGRLYLTMPRAVSDLIRTFLGTEKFEKQLGEPSLDEVGEALLITFFRHVLYADLHLPDFVGVLKNLAKSLADSAFLSEVLLWKLRQILDRAPLSAEEDQEIRRLIGSGVARMRGGTVASQKSVAAQQMQRLRKAKIVQRLRISAREQQ